MLALLFAPSGPAHASPSVKVTVHTGHHHQRPARTGMVRVYNETDRWLELYADGRWLTSIAPGTTRLELPLGSTDLQAEIDGIVLASERVHVSANRVDHFTVIAPRTGRVVIHNDGHRDLSVYVDGQWTASVDDYDTLVMNLRPGDYRIDLVDERGHGGTVSSQVVSVSGYTASRMTVAVAPQPKVRPHSPPRPGSGGTTHGRKR